MAAAETLFSTPAMAAAFSAEAHVRGMLAFEAALARAEARTGLITESVAQAIAASCRLELFDVEQIYREAVPAGTENAALDVMSIVALKVPSSGTVQ